MFNPANFQAPSVPKTLALGNSEHPVLDSVVNGSFHKVPSKEYTLYYVELNEGRVVTFRPSDRTMQLHNLTLPEFKVLVKANAKLPCDHEMITVPDTDKYLGNALLDIIKHDL